jgi:hypothetical protein
MRAVTLILAALMVILSTPISSGAWKKKDGNYQFTFAWAKNGKVHNASFSIPKDDARSSHENITSFKERARNQSLQEQFVPVEGEKNTVRFNYEKFIAEDAPRLGGLVESLKQSSPDPSPRGLAEHALGFVQSIPYSTKFENKAGYLSPIGVLVEGKGDCDSKSSLMASILTQMGIRWKLVEVKMKKINHLLVAISVPRSPNDSSFPGQEEYVMAETTNPGWALGQWNATPEIEGLISPKTEPEVKPVIDERTEVTAIVERAKKAVTKRNTGLVNAKASLKWMTSLTPEERTKVQAAINSGKLKDLGVYPNPWKNEPTSTRWEEKPPTETVGAARPAGL